MENQSKVPQIEARTRQFSVRNSEKPVLDQEDMPPTGFRDEVEPADKPVESMAQAAVVSHQDDEAEEEDDDTISVSPSMTSTTTTTGKKKKKKSKSKSKRGIVGLPTPLAITSCSLSISGQANRFRRVLRRRSSDACPTRSGCRRLQPRPPFHRSHFACHSTLRAVQAYGVTAPRHLLQIPCIRRH